MYTARSLVAKLEETFKKKAKAGKRYLHKKLEKVIPKQLSRSRKNFHSGGDSLEQTPPEVIDRPSNSNAEQK